MLHAPRQTGKTTCLLALMQHLNAQGKYRALYVNIEGAQDKPHEANIHEGISAICSAFNIKAESLRLGNFNKEEAIELWKKHTEGQPWLVNALGYECTWMLYRTNYGKRASAV